MTNYLDLAEIALRIIEKSMSKPKVRRNFSKSNKDKVKKLQKNRCKACDKKTEVWDFDHIDGDSSNNSLSNCQALCLDCHGIKTRNVKQRNLKLSQIVRTLRRFLKE